MPGRRTLRFSSLDEVMPEVERLLSGHVTVGRWSLGQICEHLSKTVRMSVEGVPHRVPWIVRRLGGLLAPMARRHRDLLARLGMPAGLPARKAFVPGPEISDRIGAESLRAALALFTAALEPLAEHPAFGPFSRDDWELAHRMHCALHLSFALPVESC